MSVETVSRLGLGDNVWIGGGAGVGVGVDIGVMNSTIDGSVCVANDGAEKEPMPRRSQTVFNVFWYW